MASWDVHSIEQADLRLKEWIAESTSGAPGSISCSLGAPAAGAAGQGFSCYLLDIHETNYLSQANQLPLNLTLRYLVTAWAAKPEDAHRLLDRVITRAINEPQLESEFQPVPLELWRALQILPQPCFFLRVLVRLERVKPKEAPMARELRLDLEPVASLSGRVLGPKDTPIMNAVVELPTLNLSALTDANGNFHLNGLPGGSSVKTHLHIRARGRAQDVTIDRIYSEIDPLIVHFDLPV
jgi:hypothetical protein